MKHTYYKEAFRSLITLSIPTVLEEVLSTLLQYVDTAMVGHLGEKATAAVSTTTTIGWLIHSIPSAIAVAVLAIASKANGAGDEAKLKKLAGQSILYAFTIGTLLEVIALVLSPYIPVWMGVEPDIVKPASVYFTITSISLVFRASSRVFSAMIRSIKDTKSPMFISVGENVLNILLNTVFIYGLNLGVAGAAIASCISFGIGGIAMFLLMLSKTKLRPTREETRPGDSVRDIYDWASGTWHDLCKLFWIHCVCADGIWYGNDDICGAFDRHYSGADCLYSRIRTACGDQYIGRKCTRREGYPEIKSNGAGIDPDHIIDYGSKWYRTLPIRISIYASVYELSQCGADRK